MTHHFSIWRALARVLVFWLASQSVMAQEIDGEEAAQIIAGALKDYEKQVHSQPGLSLKVIVSRVTEPESIEAFRRVSETKIDRESDNMLKSTNTPVNLNGALIESVSWSTNKDYCFELRQTTGDALPRLSRTILPKDLNEGSHSTYASRPSEHSTTDSIPWPISLEGLGKVELSRLGKLRELEFGKCEFTDGRDSTLNVAFTHKGNVWSVQENKRVESTISSNLTVDASKHCLPVAFQQTATSDGEQHKLNTTWERQFVRFGKASGLVAKETATSTSFILLDGERKNELNSEVSLECSYTSVPDSEFRLPAFGLPELQQYVKSPNPWPIRFAGIALLCGAVMLLIHLRSRE